VYTFAPGGPSSTRTTTFPQGSKVMSPMKRPTSGRTLLLPLPAALHVLHQRMSVDAAAIQYGISTEMITSRCNVSGARQINALDPSRLVWRRGGCRRGR
jgi:hypothetical protein